MTGDQNWLIKTASSIDVFSQWCGRTVSWLTFIMVIIVFLVVLMRYLFELGSIQLQEFIIYLHGMIFLLGAAYTFQQNEHVRVDVFYSSMNHKRRAWVDFCGTLLLLIPVCLTIFFMSYDYVMASWRINESSNETGGLPALYLLKSLILIMPVLMIVQGISSLLRCANFLFVAGESPYSVKSAATPQIVSDDQKLEANS